MAHPAENSSLRVFAPALVLLVLAFLINYIDRGNISVAGPLVKKEFQLSDSELGVLFAAFFCTYTAMQFLIGWLVDRFNPSAILAAGFLVWSLATAATGLVRGFGLLLAVRFILGVGESVAMPTGSKILAQYLPEHSRGFASGALMSALRVGNAVGTLGAGLLMAKYGWRPVFIAVGVGSLLWLPAWSRWKPRDPVFPSRAAGQDRARLLDIVVHPSFWGTSGGHFASNYLFYFMITWLPSYLVRERHLSMETMSMIAGLYYSVDAVSAIAGGWLQDWGIRNGYTATLVRKSAMALGFGLAALAAPACALAGAKFYLPFLLIAGIGCGLTGPGLYTFPQTLAGPQAVGKWYGTQNGLANFAGIIGPALTGFVLDQTKSFLAPFVITAFVCVGGILAWVFLVGRVEPVQWKPHRERSAAVADAGT
jgi:MFS family permease